jgi:hypothetical protein
MKNAVDVVSLSHAHAHTHTHTHTPFSDIYYATNTISKSNI